MTADRPRRRLHRLVPRTVRARATAAAALTMAVILAAGGGWLYLVLRHNLLDNAAERTELAARKTAAGLGPEPGDGRSSAGLAQPDGGVDSVFVLGPRGQVLAGTGPDPASRAAGLAGFRPPAGQDSASRVLCCAKAAGGQRSVAVVVRAPSPRGDRYVYGITVLNDVSNATSALALTLLIGAPLLMALTVGIAWGVTGLALRPVAAIRGELAAVTARELDRRVPDPDSGDEIARLARTVNATLDRLEQSVGRQRQFVADASHELRNPVAALRAELEVSLAGSSDARLAASVRQALGDADRLQRIITDLLLLARLDARVHRPDQAVDLALLAAEEIARRRSPRVPITLAADEPVPVRGDHAQLERLLANLVDNALRYARSAVRISAALDPAADEASLRVTDDGPGIPPESAERVFERFTRLHPARDRGSGGTGLGLAIAREIAQAHGGTLRVEPAPDGGSGARLAAVFPTGAADRRGPRS
ncbi:HAMP domain-containing sensor histidine kinase [Streptomyces sp. NPDC050617]|uniref:sensor histidine kinase n=1 Tax=Streptomyces sp. NPDC050617 TaxID=3154628 RepID=UPI00344A0B8E